MTTAAGRDLARVLLSQPRTLTFLQGAFAARGVTEWLDVLAALTDIGAVPQPPSYRAWALTPPPRTMAREDLDLDHDLAEPGKRPASTPEGGEHNPCSPAVSFTHQREGEQQT